MRKIGVALLFVVLGFGVYAPKAKALGYVDVQYNVVADITFLGGNPVATGITGTMTIRYNNGTGTGTGTTIAAGDARLMSLNASGLMALDAGVLTMTGTSQVHMGTASAIGSWGSNIPNTGTGTAPVGGLRLLGINGAFSGVGACHSVVPGYCGLQGLPEGYPVPLGAVFGGQSLTGYNNFNPAGPPSPLSFLSVSATQATAFGTIQLATNFFGAPLELGNIVGTETSRTFVPEPNTALLLGGGIIGLGLFGTSRRKWNRKDA